MWLPWLCLPTSTAMFYLRPGVMVGRRGCGCAERGRESEAVGRVKKKLARKAWNIKLPLLYYNIYYVNFKHTRQIWKYFTFYTKFGSTVAYCSLYPKYGH